MAEENSVTTYEIQVTLRTKSGDVIQGTVPSETPVLNTQELLESYIADPDQAVRIAKHLGDNRYQTFHIVAGQIESVAHEWTAQESEA